MSKQGKNVKRRLLDDIEVSMSHSVKKSRAAQNEPVSTDEILNTENSRVTNQRELAAGDELADADILHDGVELSVNGSDLEDFPDGNHEATQGQGTCSTVETTELGEISSDEEFVNNNTVASKVVKMNKGQNRQNRYSKFMHLKNDPDFKDFLSEIVDNKLAAQGERTASSSAPRKEKVNSRITQSEYKNKGGTPSRAVQPNFKSPSDTTIYSPGLRRVNRTPVSPLGENVTELSIIDKISNFVESIKIDSRKGLDRGDQECSGDKRVFEQGGNHHHQHAATDGPSTSLHRDRAYSSDEQQESELQAKQVADRLLVQAEKFRAKVEAPKGNYQMLMPYDYEKLRSKFITPEGLGPIDSEILFLRNFDQDDDFFHVTSQIDPGMRVKIERGEFVELERLLPRDRTAGKNEDLNRQLYQLITQGTSSYVDPPMTKSGKINNVRKWDQAFRVFAAIYTHANPERASEIWQYVYVIHTAVASNPWDNVYFYDINFRELMASKPWRSWGKTYTQGWNMAFNNSNANFLSSTSHHVGGSQGSSSMSNNRNSRDWKDDCCWHFNKNRCKKNGSECNYDHRCTYCAGWGHGYFNCRKRQNKQNRRSSGNSNGSGYAKNSSNSPKGDKK